MDHCTTYGPTINSTKIDRIAICQNKDDVHTIPNFYVEIRPPPGIPELWEFPMVMTPLLIGSATNTSEARIPSRCG
jgi:hypothetical protein